MQSRRVAAWVAASVSTALVLSACGGGGGTDPGGDPGAGGEGQSDATIRIYGGEPENPLIPGNTAEVFGGRVIDALWVGLIDYTADGEVENVVAESIETEDSQTYTITVGEGWTFHDGTPVTAQSFVDTWNHVAYSPNGLQLSSFYSQIQGFSDVNVDEGEPTAETMSGLAVVDDRTFTVTLTEPSAAFQVRLGHSAYRPMPQAYFDDPSGFEANPIGNGPFTFTSRVPNQEIVIERYDEYGGDELPSVAGVTFVNYTSSDAAYQDVVSNNLDFLETIPGEYLIDNLFEQDLPGRSGSQAYAGMNAMTFPLYLEEYQDVRVRQAISMAVDRQALADTVFGGRVTPSTGFIPEGVPGRLDDQCGEFCTFQPERAQQLIQEAGFTGPIQLVSNVDSTINQQWMSAACVSITNALGVECTFVPVPTFAEFLTQRQDRAVPGIYRSGWVGQYPSMEYFLDPQYSTGAGSNHGDYTNPEFDRLMDEGNAQADLEDAQALWQEAERVLVADMAAVPINDQTAQFGWSERISNAEMTYGRELDLMTVTVSE